MRGNQWKLAFGAVDSSQEAVTPQAWKLSSQKCQPFQKPHSSSAGKYGLDAKLVSASSWPLSSIGRSKNQQIKRQVVSEHGGNGQRAGPKQQPETLLSLQGRAALLLSHFPLALAMTVSNQDWVLMIKSSWSAHSLDSWLLSQSSNTKKE